MDPVELKSADGTQRIYACGKCRLVSNRDVAEDCCRCTYCKQYVEQTNGRSFWHDRCAKEWQMKRRMDALEKAEKLETWDGWVYCEDCGHNEGYFSDIGELGEWIFDTLCDGDMTPDDVPEFVFIAEPQQHALNLSDIIENLCADGYEDIGGDVAGEKELGLAIDAFNVANKNLISYWCNEKKVVAIDRAGILADYEQHMKKKEIGNGAQRSESSGPLEETKAEQVPQP